ncbi:hypothetical protein [Aliarcobacter skirrowii]|uniref:hypothetical protein n=1 Tax=Aliarcobacter skirrowii TaxID=28200 RepID=UPI0008325758|nr:hypothetical protein [Aliarcobacter skirrowii]
MSKKIFIEMDRIDSADYLVDSYSLNDNYEEEIEKYKELIKNSKVKKVFEDGKKLTILVDIEGKKIGAIYPDRILEFNEFINFISQFFDNQVLDVQSIEYTEQDRFFFIGIGFEIEVTNINDY